MGRRYKHKCKVCKQNYVMVSWRNKFPVCYDCQKTELEQPIEDPEMQKLFDIPEDLYRSSAFLRDIKLKYIRYGELSESQLETFKKVVAEMLNQPQPHEE